MKKAFAIGFTLAVLLAGLHISVSTHFCGGEIAASLVSLSGRTASCGMEGDEESCPLPWHHITNNCCDDEQKILSTVNLFTIPFTYEEDKYTDNTNLLIHNIIQFYPPYPFIASFKNYLPPGIYFHRQVSPEKICVFRI